MARFINKYLGLPAERRDEYQAKQVGGNKALAVMEQQLQKTAFLAGDDLTVADISLYAYTHVAADGGFDLSKYPDLSRWLRLIASQPKYQAMPSF